MKRLSSVLVFTLTIVGVHSRAQGLVGTKSSIFGDHPADNCICTPFYKCFDDDTSSNLVGIVDDRVNLMGSQVVISVKPTNETAVCPTTLEVRCCRRNPTDASTPPQQQSQSPMLNPPRQPQTQSNQTLGAVTRPLTPNHPQIQTTNPSLQTGTSSTSSIEDSLDLGDHQADNCICTPYYKCLDDDDTSSDTFGIVDDRVNLMGSQVIISVKPTNEHAVCPATLEVRCCNISQSPQQSQPQTTMLTPSLQPQAQSTQIPGVVPQPPIQPQNQTTNQSLQPETLSTSSTGVGNIHVCGVRNHAGVGVQVQGFTEGQAQFGEFPWTVALLTSNDGSDSAERAKNLYVGGGSLIDRHVVLTAAHKPYDIGANKKITVRLGEWNFGDRMEHIPHQDITVKEVIYHPKFNRRTMVYNVALLILEKPAVLGETVRTICLPSNEDERFLGVQCIVSGWGKDVFGEKGRYQRILKEISVNMVENSQCQREMRNTRLGSSFKLHSSFVCAGNQGHDACTGDGGSPLVCYHYGGYVQVGISAWGIGCGKLGVPGVYSAVAPTIPWIQTILKNITSTGIVGDVADIQRESKPHREKNAIIFPSHQNRPVN